MRVLPTVAACVLALTGSFLFAPSPAGTGSGSGSRGTPSLLGTAGVARPYPIPSGPLGTRAATVQVHVVDADSRADIVGATVRAIPGGARAVTAASGRATLSNVPTGWYRFTVSAPGLALRGASVAPGRRVTATSDSILVAEGAPVAIDLRLRRIDRDALNLIALHTGGAAAYTVANCHACHTDRKGELSADPAVRPWHAMITHSSMPCTTCHETVDLVNHSGAAIRRRVDVAMCKGCHAGFPTSF